MSTVVVFLLGTIFGFVIGRLTGKDSKEKSSYGGGSVVRDEDRNEEKKEDDRSHL